VKEVRFIDLFAGIGGFRLGFERAAQSRGIAPSCVFTSEIKKDAIGVYERNFGGKVSGDITKIDSGDIPDFDVLLGGFPCQAFSMAGARRGFNDTRGTLFFEIARILRDKKPWGFILENVEGLKYHDGGNTIAVIEGILRDLGYYFVWLILDAQDFGLAMRRRRIFFIGTRSGVPVHTYRVSKRIKFGDIREWGLPVQMDGITEILWKTYGKDLAGKRHNTKGGPSFLREWDDKISGEIKGKLSKEEWAFMDRIVQLRKTGGATVERVLSTWSGGDLGGIIDKLISLGYIKDVKGEYRICGGTLVQGYWYFLGDREICPTVTAMDANRIGVIEDEGIRQMSNLELKRLFGFPDEFDVSGVKKDRLNNYVFDLFGNSIAVPCVESVAGALLDRGFRDGIF